jgi:hypothetical protein
MDEGLARPTKGADDILKPKAAPVVDNILKAPAEAPEQADNILVPPKKTKAEEEAEEKKKVEEEAAAAKAKEAELAAAKAAEAAAAETDLLDEFASGNKLGDDLKQWCADQGLLLPSVEKLVFHLLSEKEQKNPDPGCAWAEASKYGSTLLSLVEDDLDSQMQVLWGIQKVSFVRKKFFTGR